VEDDGETLAARAAKGLEEEVERGFRLPIGAGFAGKVAQTLAPVIIEDLDRSQIEVVNPLMREKGVRSLLGVPMVVGGNLVGVVHVGMLTMRSFTDADAHLLQAVADRAALAVEHDRLFVQYRIAETLQRRLLPEDLPEIPSVGFAARYLPAAEASTVGGDWYDVFRLGDGRVGLAVGDVVGHGISAASLMGELRTALRVYGTEGLGAAEVVSGIARFVAARGMEYMATCAYATLDPERSVIVLANAGHPPPLVVSPGGARYIEQAVGPPLGAKRAHTYEETEVTLGPGEILLLYTDGLIERRGRRLSEGTSRLAAAAAAAPLEPELLCADVIREMLANGLDDVAVLAMQNLAPVNGQLMITLSARAEQLIAVRRAIRRWLRDSAATSADVSAIVLAANEACSNAVEHAYGPGDATFEVRGERRDHVVEVTVHDSGSWRAPRGKERGRGIALMRATMDEVEVVPGDAGTTVRLVRRLGKEKL
jgi:anti-sigma regulatory factor (Ser/Thr protein kinase)